MTVDQFFQNHDLLREIILTMFSHLGRDRWKRVEILMLMLQMSVYYSSTGKGLPFASARWYAANSFCNEKTVDRLVGWLKQKGLVRVKRLRRRDTEGAWVARNARSDNNQGWRELAQEYGPGGPFRVFPAGFYSTNALDLLPLIAKLRKLLGAALNKKVFL